jgi:uncharacterized protein involved in cysteine biosynthesis
MITHLLYRHMETHSKPMKNRGFVALITVISMMTYISLLTIPLFVRTATVYQHIQRTEKGIHNYFLNQSAMHDQQLTLVHNN